MEHNQGIHMEDEPFDEMRKMFNQTLQKLFRDMVDQASKNGKISIEVGVDLVRNYESGINNGKFNERYVYLPSFNYRITSEISVKSEHSGYHDCTGYELEWNNSKKEYVLKPITGGEQMSIFDNSL